MGRRGLPDCCNPGTAQGPAAFGRAEPVEARMATKDRMKGFFREPTPLTVMDRTTSEARLIIDEQTARRQELTAKLRAQRLARDGADTGPAPKRKKRP